MIRQRKREFVATVINDAQDPKNAALAATFEMRSTVENNTVDAADIAVFDMKGNRVADKAWKEKLKTDLHVLLITNGKLPHPRDLSLFKEETLLIVLPSHSFEVAAPTARPVPKVRYLQTPNGVEFLEEAIPAPSGNSFPSAPSTGALTPPATVPKPSTAKTTPPAISPTPPPPLVPKAPK
jgi:hypothetical protein